MRVANEIIADRRIELGGTQLIVSAVGLGCSRLGSTLAGGPRQNSIRLIHHALDRGVTLFDTADVYGQGDSERLLGEALGRSRREVVVVSKAGQRFTASQRIATLFKQPIRTVAKRVPALQQLVASKRAARLPRDFRPEYIDRAVRRSLKRLNTDWIDVFLLHSPDVMELQEGRWVEAIDRLRTSGMIRHWGVSCDDQPTVNAALALHGVGVLQLPLAVATPNVIERTKAAGIGLIIREIFHSTAPGSTATDWRAERIRQALALPYAAALVGTTKEQHLDQALDRASGPWPINES